MAQIEIIADKFSEVLKQWLTTEEFSEMKQLNETNPDYAGDCCASHNYCDANMAMHEAWVSVFGGDGIDANNEEQCEIWGLAWSLARKKHIGFQ